MTANDVLPRFQQLQYAFAAHLRDPERNAPPPGLEDRRLQVYRELFYNNLEDLLANNFPVIRALMPDTRWHGLVRAFLAQHQSHTPLFTEIGREFIHFLQARAQAGADDPPFLSELAHYEWVELALMIEEHRIEDVPHEAHGDLLAGTPVLSPLAWPLVYHWPVHRLRADFQPDEPPAQPTCLIVVRNRGDDVSFMEVDPVTVQCLQWLKENPAATGLDCLTAVAQVYPSSARDSVLAAGARMLQALCQRDVLLGTRP